MSRRMYGPFRLLGGITNTLQYETSHYAKRADARHVDLGIASAKKLLKVIDKNFGTLPFCRRYLDRLGQDKYLLGVGHTFPFALRAY